MTGTSQQRMARYWDRYAPRYDRDMRLKAGIVERVTAIKATAGTGAGR